MAVTMLPPSEGNMFRCPGHTDLVPHRVGVTDCVEDGSVTR